LAPGRRTERSPWLPRLAPGHLPEALPRRLAPAPHLVARMATARPRGVSAVASLAPLLELAHAHGDLATRPDRLSPADHVLLPAPSALGVERAARRVAVRRDRRDARGLRSTLRRRNPARRPGGARSQPRVARAHA